jgi:hypothetical protein
MIVHFVDIGGINYHHCFNFLFIIIYLGQAKSVRFVDIDGIDDYHDTVLTFFS